MCRSIIVGAKTLEDEPFPVIEDVDFFDVWEEENNGNPLCICWIAGDQHCPSIASYSQEIRDVLMEKVIRPMLKQIVAGKIIIEIR